MKLTAVAHAGVPGRSTSHGSKGWSSTLVILEESATLSVFDTGGPGYRALWPEWLAEIDRTAEDVHYVFLTHSHWDHVGAVASFSNARIFISRDELDWARGPGRSNPYVEPMLIDGLIRSGRVEAVHHGDRIGAVTVVATPGHTPGHVSYHIEDNGEGMTFVGDAIKDTAELGGGPFSITENPAASAESRVVLLKLRDRGARMLLGHDGWATAAASTGPPQ